MKKIAILQRFNRYRKGIMGGNSIGVSYAYNLFSEIVTVLIPLITTPYVSRVLGAGKLGIYSYTNSTTSFFLMFASLGLLSYASRETARVRDDFLMRSYIFWELVIFKLFAVIISFFTFFCWFLIIEKEYSDIYWILSLSFLTSFLDLSWFYRGMESFKQLSIRNTIVKIIGTILIFIFVKNKNDFPAYVICMVVPGVLGNAFLWSRALKSVDKVKIQNLNVLRHLKPILVFFIPAISVQIYHVIDRVMLQWVLHDNFENGYYDQAYKIVSICLTIITSFNGVMYSRLSNLHVNAGNTNIIKTYLNKSFSFVEMISFPMAIGIFAISARFVPSFFGKGFEDVIPLIKIFSILLIVTGLSNTIATQFLIPAGKEKLSNTAIVAGTVVNVACNIVLIPKYAAIGACIATIISEIVILAIMFILQKEVVTFVIKPLLNYLFGAVFMGIVVAEFDRIIPVAQSDLMNLLITFGLTGLGVVIYFSFLIIRKDDALNTIKSFVKK